MNTINPYDLLNISTNSSLKELKKNYYQLSLYCHPDKGGSPEDMICIKNAYEYLAKNKTTLNSLNFRTIWDIFSTPQVYVLDKDNKIIAKKLGIEQLPDFIRDYKNIQREEALQNIKDKAEVKP